MSRGIVFPCLVLLLIGSLAVAQTQPTTQPAESGGKEYRHTLDPRPAELTRANFELWIPPSVVGGETIRAVIISPLYQSDSKIYEMEDWRALATRHRVAMMRHDMRATVEGRPNRLPIGREAITAIDQALAAFARTSDHPELIQAPLVITGLSQGGGQTIRLASLIPERTVAALPFHGSSLGSFPADHPLLQVPTLIILGSYDNLTPNTLFDLPLVMGHKPLWTLFLQPATPHQTLGEQEFILLWLDHMLSARLPEKTGRDADGAAVTLRALDHSAGWVGSYRANYHLAATSAQVHKVSEAPPEMRVASWLATEALAQAWVKAMRTGIVTGHESREEVVGSVAKVAGGDHAGWPDGRVGRHHAASDHPRRAKPAQRTGLRGRCRLHGALRDGPR